jgi:type I restriction enzyme S subunit
MILNDLCEFIIDCEHKTAPIQEIGYPSIRTPNIGKGNLILDGVNRVSEEVYLEWSKRGKPEPGDLIIAREAPVGNIAIIPDGLKVCLGQRTVLVRPNNDKVDSRYLCYYLLGNEAQGQILTKTSGATVAHLNMKDIRGLKISNLPNISLQKQIASILSAYDDLIENNNQRIKLLENMAEEIYKEWFVRFRFPGYKEAAFLDKEGIQGTHGIKGAIPEGWDKRPIKDIVDIISGYAFKTEFFEEDGDYGLVTIKNVQNGFFVTKTTDYIKELPKNIKDDIFLKDKDILLSLTGNIGRICLVYGDNYLLNQRVAKLKPKTKDLFEYVYLFFRSDFLRMTLENYSNGAAQQNLSPVDTSELKFITPPDGLLEKFSDITKSFFDEIIILLKKNQILQDTRDLLLPRLISGKLSVEDLEM